MELRLGHWLFAFVASEEHDFGRALDEANAAIALAPFDAFMLGELTEILIMAGKPGQAVEWSDTSAARDPANEWYYMSKKGWALGVQEKYEESLAAFASSKPSPWRLLYMAIDLVGLNRLDEARSQVSKALQDEPSWTQAKWRDTSFYSDMSIVEREVAALAKAGLPEK
jgi:hypothetical protein